MKKVILITSAMLLSWCKDNQVKDNNQTPIEITKGKTISYEPNTKKLGIIGKYHIELIPNNHWTYMISSTMDHVTVNLSTLQDYCNNNDMGHIIITEDNKIEIVEAIVAMQLKDKLAAEWQEELGLYMFNSINQSDSQNILSAWPFDNWDQDENKVKIITDTIQEKTNNIKNQNTLSIEDQYLLAETKQNDTTLTQQERKKRSDTYNRLSTEIFKPSQQDMISISDY